jgi:hypothetical protein
MLRGQEGTDWGPGIWRQEFNGPGVWRSSGEGILIRLENHLNDARHAITCAAVWAP